MEIPPADDTPPVADAPSCEHQGGTAVCGEKKLCVLCGEEYGEAVTHSYTDGVCSLCGEPEKQIIKSPRKYSISIDPAIEHGTVIADKALAAEGELVTLTVTPDEGYELATYSISVEGPVSVSFSGNTFTMPASDVTVSVRFQDAAAFKITMSINPGYAVTMTENTVYPVPGGGSYSFTVTVRDGYDGSAMAVKVKGASAGEYTTLSPDENGVYTISNITEDQAILVTGVQAVVPDTGEDFAVTIPANVSLNRSNGVLVTVENLAEGSSLLVSVSSQNGGNLIKDGEKIPYSYESTLRFTENGSRTLAMSVNSADIVGKSAGEYVDVLNFSCSVTNTGA